MIIYSNLVIDMKTIREDAANVLEMNSQEAVEAELRPVSVMLLVYKQQLLSLPLRDTKDSELKFKSKFFPCDST